MQINVMKLMLKKGLIFKAKRKGENASFLKYITQWNRGFKKL